MEEAFYQHIFDKQLVAEAVPSNEEIAGWALDIIRLIFPERASKSFTSAAAIKEEFISLQQKLKSILDATRDCCDCDNDQTAAAFFSTIPELYRILKTDIEAILEGDPAAKSEYEVIRAYPGFYAICFYRLAHTLLKLDVPLLPRILTEYAHSQTGIDIHPGAVIGEYLYIDHGTGIVIGETSLVGSHVKLYQGVTLGALSVDKSMVSIKRHPTVQDHVIIYSGATILGGDTVIGSNSIIGGNVWLTKSIPPGSTVYHEASVRVVKRNLIK